MIHSRNDAYQLLKKLGASAHLIRHVQLVGEAADELLSAYGVLGVRVNADLIELGVAVHDAGKIEHPSELHGPGSLHEPAGEKLMLSSGVQAEVARCCVTHATWNCDALSLEERTVALADKLWKGKREPELELLVIDEIASRLGRQRWDVFSQLDEIFERIAGAGEERLRRSQEYA